ncbi:hypothetical protein STRIP9103_05340 [Streptomyces ipomoeae 91-03]|uniref:Uncharacterized protein n=1 Tax=Streptomyces ipomoeae 91-03 TaxID=698759 RepID=L1L182_9ACTN|nr:hypothetical protein STRIP9103_05340 [Streptomyces ipomoeae 91-03]
MTPFRRQASLQATAWSSRALNVAMTASSGDASGRAFGSLSFSFLLKSISVAPHRSAP